MRRSLENPDVLLGRSLAYSQTSLLTRFGNAVVSLKYVVLTRSKAIYHDLLIS